MASTTAGVETLPLGGEKVLAGLDHTDDVAVPSVWSIRYAALFLCLGISLALVLFYLIAIKPYVLLPADILMWAETNFVGDIIKLRIGAPLYGAPEDSNSTIYTPGATILTYAISWIVGLSTSIPAWRVIQLGFVTVAAAVATLCTRDMRKLAYGESRIDYPKTWLGVTFLAMFLVSTAPYSNRFAHALHADALALLISIICFWTILFYLTAPSWKRIILMAVCPTLGYLTKQFLIVWVGVMFLFLLLHDPRNVRRLGLFLSVSLALFFVSIGACYLLWGDAYLFWTFEVTGGSRKQIGFRADEFNISLARSLDHTLRAWMELGLGVIGGWLVLRGSQVIRQLGPVWVAWLALILMQGFLSGVGWSVLYYFGPGVLIGAVWLFAALPRFWPKPEAFEIGKLAKVAYGFRCAIAIAGVLTIFLALRVVPTGAYDRRSWHALTTSPDVYRYIADIEREFEGFPPDKVLLDIGNWIYLRHSVLMKDRAVSLADQPPAGIYRNIDLMADRIRNRTYEKILVRNLHSPNFFYDYSTWLRPSGVKQALEENYEEVRTIPAPQAGIVVLREVTESGPISVLVLRRIPISSSKDP